jgi:predicted ArsR family transcriptional regulator
MIALPNKVGRILENVRAVLGPNSHNSIVAGLGQLSPGATPSKQAKYAKQLVDMIVASSGEDAAERVMRTCGHQCTSTSLVERARKLHSLSTSIDEFLRLLNEEHIGGGQLHLRDGKIIGVYNTCYCGLAKQAKDMSPVCCYCSAGWYERLFSSTLGDSVKVRKVQSILDGSDKCVFEISF